MLCMMLKMVGHLTTMHSEILGLGEHLPSSVIVKRKCLFRQSIKLEGVVAGDLVELFFRA